MKIRNMLLVFVGFLAVGTMAAFPFGGRPEPKVSLTNVSLDVMIYRNGRPARTGKLAPRSAGTRALCSLLENKKGRWRRGLISYAPSIYIRSDSFNINVQNRMLIVNCKNERGKYAQAVCPLTAAEFKQIQRAVFESIEGKPHDRGNGENGRSSKRGEKPWPTALPEICPSGP